MKLTKIKHRGIILHSRYGDREELRTLRAVAELDPVLCS